MNASRLIGLLLFLLPAGLAVAVLVHFGQTRLGDHLASGLFLVTVALVLSSVVAFTGNVKIIGIYVLLMAVWLFLAFDVPQKFFGNNIENVVERTAMFGILGIGVAFVIITAGIDLSIGSIVGLMACLLAIFLHVDYVAVDDYRVLEVRGAEKVIVVEGQSTLEAGGTVRYFGGRQALATIVNVTRIESVQHETDRGRSIAATAVHVDTELSSDDTRGRLAEAHRLLTFDAGLGEDQKQVRPPTITLAGGHNLAVRDRVVLAHPQAGLKDHAIIGVGESDGRTVLTLKGDLGSNFSDQWRAIAFERKQRMSVFAAVGLVLAIGLLLGVVHGLLVTEMRLQPFVVTLCGLLIYRSAARTVSGDQAQGFGVEYQDSLSLVGEGKLILWSGMQGGFPVSFGIPVAFFALLAVAVIAAIFLNKTVWGRYMLALGHNEEAARFSGINTKRMTVLAYVICTGLAAFGGMLFAVDANSVSPVNYGSFFELYAIAAAVLGGCSLRGGEGSILGVVIGTFLMQSLYNVIILEGISDSLEFGIIGIVILLGVIADELIRRFVVGRRTAAAQVAARAGVTAVDDEGAQNGNGAG